jgi:hypothetical protein
VGGIIDVGTEELFLQPEEEVWQKLQANDNRLGIRAQYALYCGQEEIQWSDLPKDQAVIIRREMPVPPGGDETGTVAMMNRRAIQNDQPIPQLLSVRNKDLLVESSADFHSFSTSAEIVV